MTPLFEHRLLLWGFQGVPELSYQLNVKGPLIGERDVPQFAFVRAIVGEALRDALVLPRRTHISFDYDFLGQEARACLGAALG